MHTLALESFPDAVLLADDRRQYINANAAACQLLGRSKSQLIGSKIDDVFGAPADAIDEMWKDFLARGTMEGDVELHDALGAPIQVEFRARANVAPGIHLSVLRKSGDRTGRLPVDVLIELISIQRVALAPDVELTRLMQTICARAASMTRAQGATIELHDGEVLEYRVATGSMAPFLGFRIAIAGSLSGLAFSTHEVLVCSDSEVDPRVDRAACRKVGARSMIVVPLVNEGIVVGVLKVVSSHADAFDPSAVDLLRLIAGFLGTAMVAATASEARRMLAERERARLVELERLREEMTSLLVHDLRSPLSVIMANLDFLRDQLPQNSTDAVEAAIDALQATQRLDILIKSLLETAKLEQGRLALHREQVSLRKLVDELVKVRATAARTRKLALTTSVDEALVADVDRDLVHRVFDNILDNAFRYATPGGRIDISIAREGTSVIVRIGNTGAALPDELKARVFEKFEQADRGARRHFGLGLYFCKLAIEAHGGSVWVESSDELPTIFAFRLS